MKNFYELLEKRENLTASIYEEEDLIEMSKTMPEDELKDIDPSLLTYSNGERLESISEKIDALLFLLNQTY